LPASLRTFSQTLDRQIEFRAALERHCREAALIVERAGVTLPPSIHWLRHAHASLPDGKHRMIARQRSSRGYWATPVFCRTADGGATASRVQHSS
jgi:hypothetical protein